MKVVSDKAEQDLDLHPHFVKRGSPLPLHPVGSRSLTNSQIWEVDDHKNQEKTLNLKEKRQLADASTEMTQMLKLSGEDFKIAIIKMFQIKIINRFGKNKSISREAKKQNLWRQIKNLKLKDRIIQTNQQTKHLLDRLHSIMKKTEERISECEDKKSKSYPLLKNISGTNE